MSFELRKLSFLMSNCAQATQSCEVDATKLAKGFARTVSSVRRIFGVCVEDWLIVDQLKAIQLVASTAPVCRLGFNGSHGSFTCNRTKIKEDQI